MPWIFQVIGLQKNKLTFTDEEGNEIKMVKPKPKWVKVLQNPINALKKKKANFLEQNRYGPPWIENEEMLCELIEECTSTSIGLQTIHECLAQKLDPNLPFVALHSNRPMHYAARHGNIYMALMLLRAGAKLNPRNSLGQTPFHVCASGRLAHHTSFLRWMLSRKVDVNEKDRGGNTALVLAVVSCAKTNVGVLLHHKATVTVKNKQFLALEDPEALAIAKYVRAVDNRLPIELAEEYFEVQTFLGPSILDRIFSLGLCSESHKIVNMLESSLDGNYLNYYETHKDNFRRGMIYIWNHYIMRRKSIQKEERKKKKVLQVQKASEEAMLTLMEAKRRKRQIKKDQFFENVRLKNVEAARREIANVQSRETLQKLYGKTEQGGWVKEKDKDGKEKWVYREVEAGKSLGVGLDSERFIGYDVLGEKGKTLDEIREEKAISKLVKDLDKLEGKKIEELGFHKKDFSIGGLPPPSREGVKFRNGQRISVVADADFLKKGMRRQTKQKTKVAIAANDEAQIGNDSDAKKLSSKRGDMGKMFSFSTGWAKLAPGEEVEPPKERKTEEEEDNERKKKRRNLKRQKKKAKKREEEDERREKQADSDSWSD